MHGALDKVVEPARVKRQSGVDSQPEEVLHLLRAHESGDSDVIDLLVGDREDSRHVPIVSNYPLTGVLCLQLREVVYGLS